ncbi:MAG: hypothetical protein AAGN66_25445 [Acidobacteriota bacterium]
MIESSTYKSDTPRPQGQSPWRALSAAALAAALLAAAFWAPVAVADEAALRSLEARYEVIELSDGWLLRPESDDSGIRQIEVRDGEVRVDREALEPEALLLRLGDDGRALLDLAGLEAPPEAVLEVEAAAGDAAPLVEDPSAATDPVEAPLTEARTETGAVEVESAVEEEGSRERRRRADRRSRNDTQVSVGSGLDVQEDEIVSDVVVIGNDLDVAGAVDGDAVVVFGSARVSGRVDGTLTIVGGSLELEDGGEVDGDVVTVGGGVNRGENTHIDGELVQVDFDEVFGDDFLGDWGFYPWFGFDVWDLIGRVFKSALVAILALLFLVVANRRVPEVADRARREPWKAGLVGLVVEVLFFPLLGLVCVILLASVIGIPLLLVVPPLAALLGVVFFFLGYAAIALLLGDWLRNRFDLGRAEPAFLLLLGVLAIEGWSILGEVLTVLPQPLKMMAYLLLLVGFLVKYLAWTVGLGAAVLHQFSPLPTGALPAFAAPGAGDFAATDLGPEDPWPDTAGLEPGPPGPPPQPPAGGAPDPDPAPDSSSDPKP